MCARGCAGDGDRSLRGGRDAVVTMGALVMTALVAFGEAAALVVEAAELARRWQRRRKQR